MGLLRLSKKDLSIESKKTVNVINWQSRRHTSLIKKQKEKRVKEKRCKKIIKKSSKSC